MKKALLAFSLSILFVFPWCPDTLRSPLAPAGQVHAQSLLRKVGTFIDSMSVRGVDRSYIDAPKQPWQIILKGNTGQTDVKMVSNVDISKIFTDMSGNWQMDTRIKSVPTGNVGLWVGYRGYGIGYSADVGHDRGFKLTLGATGGSYGINIRFHNFDTDESDIHYTSDIDGEHYEEVGMERLEAPIKVKTVIADGYYMFNGKHFSYAAAYDQSVVQLRSAGSIVAGGMYYYAHINYATPRNVGFIIDMGDVGRLKQWQGSIGAGYAYNYVPARGWLVSAMAMPMLTFYNRLKIWRYDSNLGDYLVDILDLEYKYQHGMISETEYNSMSEEIINKIEIHEYEASSHDSKLKVNFDARLSVTYQWSRYFVNAYGQFNTFRYGHDDTSGRLNDWYVNASFGVRL